MFGSGEKSHGCFHPTLTQGIQQGIQQGAQQKTVENARKLLTDGKYTAEKISKDSSKAAIEQLFTTVKENL